VKDAFADLKEENITPEQLKTMLLNKVFAKE